MDLSTLSEEELRKRYKEIPQRYGQQKELCERFGVKSQSSFSRWLNEKSTSPQCANAVRQYLSELHSSPVGDNEYTESTKVQREECFVLAKSASNPASLPPRNLRKSQTPCQSKDPNTCKLLEKYEIAGMVEKEQRTAILLPPLTFDS